VLVFAGGVTLEGTRDNVRATTIRMPIALLEIGEEHFGAVARYGRLARKLYTRISAGEFSAAMDGGAARQTIQNIQL